MTMYMWCVHIPAHFAGFKERAVGRDFGSTKKKKDRRSVAADPWWFFGKALEAETHKRQGLAFWAPQEEL